MFAESYCLRSIADEKKTPPHTLKSILNHTTSTLKYREQTLKGPKSPKNAEYCSVSTIEKVQEDGLNS